MLFFLLYYAYDCSSLLLILLLLLILRNWLNCSALKNAQGFFFIIIFFQELQFCWNQNILSKEWFKKFLRKVLQHQEYWQSATNTFTQEQLTAMHWGWVLLLVWYLCCTEASIRPLYKGLCCCTYPKCHPNLLCKIILRKVWESQKTNANRELCRHNPRAAFDCSICIVRCLLWASFSPKLSDLFLCSYAWNKIPAPDVGIWAQRKQRCVLMGLLGYTWGHSYCFLWADRRNAFVFTVNKSVWLEINMLNLADEKWGLIGD